jgi:hypothetical protein
MALAPTPKYTDIFFRGPITPEDFMKSRFRVGDCQPPIAGSPVLAGKAEVPYPHRDDYLWLLQPIIGSNICTYV